jgi:hypothetical protein
MSILFALVLFFIVIYMGLANEIINIAFGILFGGIAIATALAFGLGGKEIASRRIGI